MKVKVAQSCLTLCNSMDHTVHGILQARVLERVVVPFSRGSSQPRGWTQVSCTAGRFFTSWGTRAAQEYWSGKLIPFPVDLPDPGIKPGSPALQVDSLPTELSGKPHPWSRGFIKKNKVLWYIPKRAPFFLSSARSMRRFFSDIYCGNLVKLLKVNLTILWEPSHVWILQEFFSLQTCLH